MNLSEMFPVCVGNEIRRTFALMEVAEQEISAARRQRNNAPGTERRARIDRSFLMLKPPSQLMDRDELVYRSHVRELLARVADDEDLRPGTDAEVLCAMLDCSLQAPPKTIVLTACERLFYRVMGRMFEPVTREPYPGAVDELIADVRRKVAVQERKLK